LEVDGEVMDAHVAALIVTGFAVGAVSGMLGIGGAVVLVPTLVLVFGYTQARAQGTSLGALVPPIGIFAAIQYYRHGLLDLRAAMLIALGFIFGALGGATLVPYIPQVWLKRAFAALLVFVAAQLVFGDPNRRMAAVLPGMVAVAALWTVYGIQRAFGRKAKRPRPRMPDTEYYL
jgi:uncharacterized membrane protein YfcA